MRGCLPGLEVHVVVEVIVRHANGVVARVLEKESGRDGHWSVRRGGGRARAGGLLQHVDDDRA